jgi:hypothetical protein
MYAVEAHELTKVFGSLRAPTISARTLEDPVNKRKKKGRYKENDASIRKKITIS